MACQDIKISNNPINFNSFITNEKEKEEHILKITAFFKTFTSLIHIEDVHRLPIECFDFKMKQVIVNSKTTAKIAIIFTNTIKDQGGIYGIFNANNGKIYIGSAQPTTAGNCFERRAQGYMTEFNKDVKEAKQPYLTRAVKKEPTAFKFLIFEIVNESMKRPDLLALEDGYQREYNSRNRQDGYNIVDPTTDTRSEHHGQWFTYKPSTSPSKPKKTLKRQKVTPPVTPTKPKKPNTFSYFSGVPKSLDFSVSSLVNKENIPTAVLKDEGLGQLK